MAQVLGWQGKLGIDSSNPVTKQFDFLSSNFTSTRQIIDFSGARGTRSRSIDRVRWGPSSVAGSITMAPTPVELASLLPWILGADASGTTYALAETLQSRYVTVDNSMKVMVYDGVKVAKATFNCVPSAPMTLTLDLVGLTETVNNAGTFPSLTVDSTTQPFFLQDAGAGQGGAITVNGTTTCTDSISITIDNAINPGFFTNCTVGAPEVITTDRIITCAFTPGYGDHSALYPLAETGVATVVTFVNGAVSLSFSFVKVIFARQSPVIASKTDIIRLPLNGEAKQTSSTKELVVTLDSTP